MFLTCEKCFQLLFVYLSFLLFDSTRLLDPLNILFIVWSSK